MNNELVIETTTEAADKIIAVIKKLNKEHHYDFSHSKDVVNGQATLKVMTSKPYQFYILGTRTASLAKQTFGIVKS